MTAYLVQYGRSAFVGRFRSAEAVAFARGDRVVVRGPRGLELGTVLCEPAAHVGGAAEPDGDLLRLSSTDDDAAAARFDALGREILAAADASGLPVAFVDIEVSLDGSTAVLHGLPWGACDAGPLFEQLSDRFGLAVRLLDLSRSPTANDPPDPAKAGCGKPGCGSEGGGCSTGSCGTGGGCSTGSCSRGKVKSAADLTAYFADLRTKMEELSQTRTPLA